MKFALVAALVMGANSLSLNRPHDHTFFADGVSEDEVDQMTKEYET